MKVLVLNQLVVETTNVHEAVEIAEVIARTMQIVLDGSERIIPDVMITDNDGFVTGVLRSILKGEKN